MSSMQHCQRLDQRLHLLSVEIRNMSQEKERGEQVWRERLQRCQRQLKAKEEEMSRQSQYFENFKTQLHHKLSSYRDREQSLLKRIYTLEKQLLDITVSAATGMASIKGVRITAGPEKQSEDQDKLSTMRGEGEGEEEKKEDSRTYCLPSMSSNRAKSPEGDKEKVQAENKEAQRSLNDPRIQGFIFSLQEDLRVLLEREEAGMTERRVLMEQLQEAQEKNQLLACKMEEMKTETNQLRLSETSLIDEVEAFREENQRLLQMLKEAPNQTHLPSSSDSESTHLRLGANWPCSSHDVCWMSSNRKQTSPKNSGEVQPSADDGRVQSNLTAVPSTDHQAAAVYKQNDKKDFSLPAKWNNLPKYKAPVLFQPFFNKPKCHLQSLPFTTETLGDFNLGDVEESSSEESDALRSSYQSLGFDEDLQQECEHPTMVLQHRKEPVKAVTLEKAELKSQHRKPRCEEQTTSDFQSLQEKSASVSSCNGIDSQQPFQDDFSFDLNQEDMIQALNQENRALANRIQDLLAHIELKNEEMQKKQIQLKEQISKLEESGVRLELEKQEQSCLILELTRKTEDDLNTILELQQKLTEAGGVKEESPSDDARCQNYHLSPISAHFQSRNSQEEDADNLVTSMLNENVTQFIQENDCVTKAPLEKHCSFPNNLNGVDDGLLTAQVTQLTNLVQNLKREQEEITGNLNNLREQQNGVSLSVQTQTEEKQQLTRAIWTLKEERDRLFEALSNLKQEKEKLTKLVSGLKVERDQVQRSTNALKEEKKQLTESTFDLERQKEATTELISSKKEEEDIIIQKLQDLQQEREQLSQAVLYLKQQKDKLGLLTPTLEKEKMETKEVLISCSKQEKSKFQMNLGSREETKKFNPCFNETEENQKKSLSSISAAAETDDDAVPECETRDDRETLIQEKNDRIWKITTAEEILKKSQEELDRSHSETKRLCSELCQSEARRSEAERREAEQMMRLTHAASMMEDTKRDNENLSTQIKELQVKLSILLREKTEVLFLKAQAEEQHKVLAAQLKAKTVALEELNSEYIELKQGQSSRDDLSAALVSLRATYQDIRVKYDKLLKSKGLTDLDVVPLKAKLSSLVLKCQERNGLLLQMMRAMRRQGCMDPMLAQQVEHLLNDVALQDYSAAFTTSNHLQNEDCCRRFTQEFISKCQVHTNKVTLHQTCPVGSSSVLIKKNEDQCAEKEQHSSICVNETSTNLQTCKDSAVDVAETQKKNSPDQSPPVKERARVQGSPELNLNTNNSKVFSATELVHGGSRLVKLGFDYLDMKEKSSSDPGRRKKSPQNPSFSTSSIGSSRRLSSPEKILNMHEELQRTLMSSFQSSECRGREQHPSRCLSPSNPADQNSFSSSSLPAPLSSFKPFSTSAVSNQSSTLFTAVSSRSANLSSSMSTNHHLKAVFSETCAALSSCNSPPTLADGKQESVPGSCKGGTTFPNQTKKIPTVPDLFTNTHADSPPLTTFNCNDIDPKITPTDIPAPHTSNASRLNIYSMTSKIYDAPAARAALTVTESRKRSPYSSPESSIKSAKRFPHVLKESSRSKPEAPAEVRSIEVIKTVGQSSLLIGWERPALDELGCSNGTFVYGYRVFVNGDFHKSVMSSACTKCILENINLTAPVHIQVQTLGSNGHRSDSVHITYTMSQQD